MVRDLGELGLILQRIVTRLETNQNLMKLLYYTDKDPLNHDDLSQEFIRKNIFEKNLKIVPRVGPKENASSIVAIRVISGRPSINNQFRDVSIGVEVFVPMTQWIIKDSNLRPFAIMGEISKSLNNKNIDGLGQLTCNSYGLQFLTDEMSDYEMIFTTTQYD